MHFIAVLIFTTGIIFYWNSATANSAEPNLIQNSTTLQISELINSKVDYTEYKEPLKPRDPRAISLEKYLRKQKSPLASHADLLVERSDATGIDYKLVVAIAGLESGYCAENFAKNNCWGFGNYSWSSLETGIKEYYRLMKKNYFAKGLNTIGEIHRVYAPSSTDYLNKYYYHFNQIS